MKRGLSRREFLKASAAGAALLVTGLSVEACGEEAAEPAFLTAHERDTLSAAVSRIVPTDATPGAAEAGVVDYVEQLLTAFEHDPPRIFPGGPFSGRQPYGDDATGRPSGDFPANDFQRFVPLTRVTEIAWRVRIYGSERVEGGDFNDAVLGPTKGLRRSYREGLAQLDVTSRQLHGAQFVALAEDQQDEVLKAVPQDFAGLLLDHTLEGMYAAPEYGGNRELTGWRANSFEGDSQPLGYSVYDASTGEYRERGDHPMSTANPGEDFQGLDDIAIEVVGAIALGTGGKRFF